MIFTTEFVVGISEVRISEDLLYNEVDELCKEIGLC